MTKRDHPLYSRWKNMMARCYVQSNSGYKYYGAKGVTVDERWKDFWTFVEDIDNHLENGKLLYEKGWQLDKDVKGGNMYSLETCTVLSAKENRHRENTKSERSIVAIKDDEVLKFKSIAEATRVLGMNRATIQACLKSEYNFKYCDEKS